MTIDGGVDILTIAGGSGSGGAAFAQTEATGLGVPELASPAERRRAVARPSWDSACECPQLCLRDHERD